MIPFLTITPESARRIWERYPEIHYEFRISATAEQKRIIKECFETCTCTVGTGWNGQIVERITTTKGCPVHDP
jgi:hypothetical protein